MYESKERHPLSPPTPDPLPHAVYESMWDLFVAIGDQWLLLVEGEPDAIAAHTAGIPAVAVPGSQGWNPKWASRFSRFPRIAVAFDCDQPGRSASPTVAADLARTGSDALIVT